MSSKPNRMVALTGGIGSGKSTVAKLFAARGARIIDADVLARQVVVPGEPALTEISSLFGKDVIAADGTLNRKALASIVFSDSTKREALERILHPRIREAFNQAIAAGPHAPLTVYVVPLFFESNNPPPGIDGVIVVSASQETCIARITSRDGITREQALSRINSQLPLEHKVSRANWIIYNDSSPEALIPQVENVCNELVKAC